jgi:tetrapyrrole methylase family protein/MazG family protein
MNWESLKKAEKGYKNNTEILRAIPKAMPALMRGQKIVSKADKLGINMPLYEEFVSDKTDNNNNVYDAVINLLNTLKSKENSTIEDEMEIVGNILLGVLKISVNRQINAEYALTKALEKFINRLDDFENS